MKKLLLLPLFALLFVWGKVEASHIVGGEIVITHVQGFQYVLTMNLYRDASGIAAPNTAQIQAFQRVGLNQVGTWTLPLLWDSIVPPEIPGCGGSQVVIERYFYQDTVQLPPTTYNHPSGYLFRWTSCCRNAGVVNIQNSSSAGQNTVTLFPPVVDQAGNQIINSTPQLFPPLADYGCVGQFYYQEFGGVDPDGDSLSYVLYTPFEDGNPTGGIVNPISAPFPDPSTQFTPIAWANCYNVDNQINGFSNATCTSLNEPDRLRVNPTTGFVSVTPGFGPAYYVIGVWCQEFRDTNNDGVKELIGSVFRDFQLQVTVNCAPGQTPPPPIPVAAGQTINDTVFVPGVVGQRCVQYKVTDPNAGNAIPNPASDVEIILNAVNFPDSTVGVTPSNLLLQTPADTIVIDLCFGDCAFSVNNEPLILEIIYKKVHCPKPIYDTVRLHYLVEAIPAPQATVETRDVNFPSQFFVVDEAPNSTDIEQIEFFIRPNWQIEFSLGVVDSVYDSLFQYIVYNNDTLDYLDYGMEFFQYTTDSLLPADSVVQTDTIKGLGSMETTFRWTPDCSLFQAGNIFRDTIFIVTEDRYCSQNITSKPLIFNILNTNERPEIVSAIISPENTETPETIQGTQVNDTTWFYSFTKRVGTDRSIGGSGKKEGESLIVDLKATDADFDELFNEFYVFDNDQQQYLTLLESRDRLNELGISTGRTNNGIGDDSLVSTLNWDARFITCEALEYNPIQIMAITTDSSCFAAQAAAVIEINLDNGTPPILELYQDLDDGTELIPRDGDGNVQITFSSSDLSFFVTGYDRDTVEVEPTEFEPDKVRLGVTLEDLDINDTEDVFDAKNIEATYRNPLQYVERNDTIFFSWNPACEDRETPLDRLQFKVRDNACPSDPDDNELGLIDEMFVEILPVGEFNAINVITPNGDGYNDRLELYAVEGNPDGRDFIVEPMQCGFESIKVYNRYGQLVFESEEKDFSWDAANVPAGDYFYQMKFGNRTYKSYIKVLK